MAQPNYQYRELKSGVYFRDKTKTDVWRWYPQHLLPCAFDDCSWYRLVTAGTKSGDRATWAKLPALHLPSRSHYQTNSRSKAKNDYRRHLSRKHIPRTPALAEYMGANVGFEEDADPEHVWNKDGMFLGDFQGEQPTSAPTPSAGSTASEEQETRHRGDARGDMRGADGRYAPEPSRKNKGDGTNSTERTEEEQDEYGPTLPQPSRTILLYDGCHETLPRYVFHCSASSELYYKPKAGTTTFEVTSADAGALEPVGYSMRRDVTITSGPGRTRESLNRIRAVKECLEGGDDLLMVWAAKLYKAWQSGTSVRLRLSDNVTMEWGAQLPRQTVHAPASRLEFMDITAKNIDTIVNSARCCRYREARATARAHARWAGDKSAAMEESTAGVQRSPPTPQSTRNPVSERASSKQRVFGPSECAPGCKGKNKSQNVQVEIKEVAAGDSALFVAAANNGADKDAAASRVVADSVAAEDIEVEFVTSEEDAGERELRVMKRKRLEIIESLKLIRANREQTLHSAEQAFAKDVEEAKNSYCEAVRRLEQSLEKAKQQAQESYRQEMETVEDRKQELFKDFWGQR